jgi:hypothetical protein
VTGCDADQLAAVLDNIVDAARFKLGAHHTLEVATAARDTALAPLMNRCGLSAPMAAAVVRDHLLGVGLSEDQLRVVGVSEQTIRPAARTARHSQ